MVSPYITVSTVIQPTSPKNRRTGTTTSTWVSVEATQALRKPRQSVSGAFSGRLSAPVSGACSAPASSATV
ncbi:hypothetical protein [Corynebacterium frankenforstense]